MVTQNELCNFWPINLTVPLFYKLASCLQFSSNKLIFLPQTRDILRRACGHVDVGTCPHQVFAATLTLFQPGGAGYAHHLLMSPPSFESHRRTCKANKYSKTWYFWGSVAGPGILANLEECFTVSAISSATVWSLCGNRGMARWTSNFGCWIHPAVQSALVEQ